MSRRRVVIHLDEVVVHGHGSVDPARLGPAIQAEVQRLLAERGVPEAWQGEVRLVQRSGGADVEIRGDADIDQLGRSIARLVVGKRQEPA